MVEGDQSLIVAVETSEKLQHIHLAFSFSIMHMYRTLQLQTIKYKLVKGGNIVSYDSDEEAMPLCYRLAY